MLIDTHCHLNFKAFDHDRAQVVERGRDAGVGRFICPGTDLETSREALALCQVFPEVFAAVGFHPTEASQWDPTREHELRDLALSPKVVAIGEIGLDYYWDRAPRQMQRDVFCKQLQIASDLGLPVIVHIRNTNPEDRQAMADALTILDDWCGYSAQQNLPHKKRPGVLHSFAGNEAEAEWAMANHFWIGISGPVTFQNAKLLQRLVTTIPLDYLLVETDAPFLTPHPHRGQRNEPAYVRFIAEKIAALRGIPVRTIEEATTSGAERLFNW